MTSSAWEAITIVFGAVFSFLQRRDLNRVVGPAQRNPHPFGTREWKDFVDAQATYHERMVLRMADLEAQVNQTTELAEALQEMANFQASMIKDLRLENSALRNGPDIEILERIYEKMHTPIKKPAQEAMAKAQPPEQGSSEPGNATVSSVAGSTNFAANKASESSNRVPEAFVSPGARIPARPLTLAEELEAHLREESEDESEAVDP
ncbi:hypothetical protein N8I77_003234 [Diaporthe amygdali]|uniref:Uncharacterized protein n=1 Tax=Phomopsis amygdali TaxID=1214568 RepID=A0AAD9SKX8_PHOAM|nr:hypothetical protein N8I77_003234 [Diaporthe amygdali]